MSRDLTKRELGTGLIYIFWLKGNFGYVKIGKTSENPQKRLKQWTRACKETFELHPSSYDIELVQIPHVYRVETLIHTELKYYRAKVENCKGCGKSHNEWFKVSEEFAKKIFHKWSKWIQSTPYEECIEDEKVVWKLKDTFEPGELRRVCQPVEPDQQVTSKSRPRLPRRKSGRKTAYF